ncbi:MAG TPA: ATP-binding protein [Blastocatellia bacterium]|nr:ATP-binding protein [Blastocatellia bacterium]
MAIRAKLVIIVFVFAILPMFLVTARWSSTAVGSRTDSLRADLDARVRGIAHNVDQTLRLHFAEMARLADSAPMKAYVRGLTQNGRALPDAQLRTALGAFLLAHQQEYASLTCVGRDGRPLFRIETGSDANGFIRAYFTESGFAPDAAALSGEVFKAARPDLPVISEVEQGGDGIYVRVGMPLRHYGQVSGEMVVESDTVAALIARVRADQLLVESAGPTGPVSGSAGSRLVVMGRATIILDGEGRVLYAADKTKLGRKYQEAFPDVAAAFAVAIQNAGGRNADQDIHQAYGSNWLIRAGLHPSGSTDELPSPKLTILALENHSDAVRDLEYAGFTMYVLTFVLAIVLTLLLYYLISGVTDSIRRVTRGARAITAGRLDHRIEIKTEETRMRKTFGGGAERLRRMLRVEVSGDETRVLADAFNRMAARLREMIARESEQKQFESFTRLSAVLTHDLKNSIFSLSLLVQNMGRKFDREGFREDAMRTLSNSVSDLQGLVARLSDPLAQSTFRQATDLSVLVERVLGRIGENTDARYDVHTSLLPHLTASIDAKAVERVVENLIINALEAMPEGGRLGVATRVENEAAIITVADTGRGMSEEFIRERLFRPFATTKRKGIGLGLYSCRDIIEQHGGRIEVSSRPDVGTEFRVVLPLVAEVVKAEEEQPAAV